MYNIILLAGCIICVLIAIYFSKEVEQFTNPVVVSNINKTPSEVFLVAPNPRSFSINSAPDSFSYATTGYTHAEAIKACEAVGPGVQLADLTTLANSPSGLSLQVALDLSANWCAAGWTANDSTYAYFPMSNFTSNKCALPINSPNKSPSVTTTPSAGMFSLPTAKGYGVYNPGTTAKAFAICVGPKPGGESTPVATVNKFNANTYSMYNTAMISYLQTGVDTLNKYNSDNFPIPFTDAQVYVALQKNSYNVANARSWLITSYGTAATTSTDPLNASPDARLYTPEASSVKNSWETNTINQNCTALTEIYNNMDSALSSLKTLFQDLSGNVKNIINSKTENGILQTTIVNICTNTSNSLKSAACGRLLSLDFDIFYRNNSTDPYVQNNAITNLDQLNYSLRVRECEIQKSLGSLQQVLTAFGQTPGCATTLSNLTAKYKNNMIVTESTNSDVTPIDCGTYFNEDGSYNSNPTKFSAPTTAFKIGREIEYNDVDLLKLSLQEISPFFSGNQYASLISGVLNQLSITLRTPLPTEYSNVEAINNNTAQAVTYIQGLFGNTGA